MGASWLLPLTRAASGMTDALAVLRDHQEGRSERVAPEQRHVAGLHREIHGADALRRRHVDQDLLAGGDGTTHWHYAHAPVVTGGGPAHGGTVRRGAHEGDRTTGG